MGDLHSGHRVGLTPPRWQWSLNPKWGPVQSQLWDAFTNIVDSLKPIDILFVNGDCVDGKGIRSGGTELITPDRKEQAEMAAECINYIGAEKIVMTYGTPYHTGVSEDWEDIVAEKVGAEEIGSHLWPQVNGVVFDLKHKVGNTTVPYSKGTAISKERLWNLLWNEHDEQPKANIILRSHIHWYFQCGDADWQAIYLPALQGMGSKFGGRQCQNIVHFGAVHFDIEDNGRVNWKPHIVRISTQRRGVLPL